MRPMLSGGTPTRDRYAARLLSVNVTDRFIRSGPARSAAHGGVLATASPPPWTLSARVEGSVLEFSLGDGRRLVWRATRPAHLVGQAGRPLPAAELLGTDLAERLAGSVARMLNVQFDATLDGIAWEQLGVGDSCLAARFAMGRQIIGEEEADPPPRGVLADALAVARVHDGAARAASNLSTVALAGLPQADARAALALPHVLVLEGVPLARLVDQELLGRRECLLVVPGPQLPAHLSAALDLGAAVLVLGRGQAPDHAMLDTVLLQLGGGASVGEALRALHRHAGSEPVDARLYGDPGMRFVRLQAPTSLRQVTSLSFDLVGSTTLLQTLGNEGYADMLVRLYALCTDAVRRHGGQPDEYQGDDGIMCYFGHPSAVEGAPEHAVRAGLDITRIVAELGVSVRVGISTGPVAIKAGHPVGLSIHLAARLQNAAQPRTVLISEETRQLVAHAFELQPLPGPLALKGILQPVSGFLVLGPRGDATAHRLERASWLTPLVGRQEELARLRACFLRARDGGSRLAVVRGDAGVGKSRLVREFRHQLVQSGVKVLECRCRADASASPYLALAEALRRWLGVGADEVPRDALDRLAAALPEKARRGEALQLLASFLGLAPQPARSSPASVRQRLQALLLDWFGAFAGDRASCLVVEDWHWVDPSMREFVEHLAARRDGPGLLVVLTTRGEPASAPAAPGSFELLELAGLPPDAARQLVGLVCGDAALPARLVRMLAARGDGVPLFLEEATRMALELGADRLDTDVAALEVVPTSLQDLLMARLDGLGDAKAVAQVAAVVGREFTLSLLAALLESGGFATDAATVTERLATLVESGLVRSHGGGRYAFKHALVRDAAYASLWTSHRLTLHARVVTLLKERWPELAAAQPELLALHQTEAGQHREALAQWELAASNATARSAELEAISHLRRALAVLARIDADAERDRMALRLQLLLAARLIATEGYGAEAVLQAYREAERLCDRIGDDTTRFKVEMGLEAYRFMRADFDLALEHGRRAAAIAARTNDSKQRLQAHWGLACTLFHQGELRATMREMESALALYSPAMHRMFGVQDPGIMCLAYSSWGLWERGRPDAALARINQAAAIAREFEHKFSQAVALAYGVSVELLRGETEAALHRADACIRVCEEAGFPVWLAITRCMRGRLLCEQGRFEVGLGEMRAGYALWLSTGAMVSRPLYLALQAEGLMLAGQLDEAAACVEDGLSIIARYGERQLEAELRRLRGELAWQRGDSARAEASLKAAYAGAIRQHRLGFALRSATTLARLWAADGRRDQARSLLAPLVGRWSEGRGTRDVRAALAVCESLR